MNMNENLNLAFELLQYCKENPNIVINNENDVAVVKEAMNRDKVLKNHPYKIVEVEKHNETYYLTYVYDETKKNHRRQITAKTKANLENKIYSIFLKSQVKTFKDVYDEWYNNSYQKEVKEQTHSRMGTDYTRFLENDDFIKKPIEDIESCDVEELVHKLIIDFKLRNQGYKNLKSLLNGVFKYAKRKKYITENPMDFAEFSTANIVPPKKEKKESVVFTTEEANLIKKAVADDKANFKTSLPFGILLSFQLGLRVSELIALKWSDIENNTIHIQRQEICYTITENATKRTIHKIVEYTKTIAGDRILPLSKEALTILEDIKKWNKEHNIVSEYIFADKDGNNFNRQRFNTRLYRYCDNINIVKKSSHKIRRCVISTLLDNVKNKDSVRLFAGHEKIQTTFNAYYKDISSDKDFFDELCACL